MQHIICAVHDRQLAAFMRPFVAQTTGQAIRSFRDEVNRQGSEMNQHPEDYTLHKLGYWDEETGSIEPLKDKEQIAIASNLIERSARATPQDHPNSQR